MTTLLQYSCLGNPMDREASQAMVPGSQTDGQLFSTSWTVACQALLSMRFPRQEYWSELLFPSPGDLSNPRIEPVSPKSPALAGGLFTTSPTLKPC